MNLIIDVGNTFTKLAVFQNDDLIQKKTVATKDFQKLILEEFSLEEITAAVISNVTKEQIALPPALHHVELVQLSPSTILPFENLYATPLTLGNDRKALVAAAVRQYPEENVLVIDAGTCITYDFKNRMNHYLGGGISPGLEMRFKALNTFTANLPLVEKQKELKLVGDSTVNSINSGVVFGVLKEVDGVIEEYASKYEKITTIITGGDAQFLSVNLKNSIFANSNFLLEGLNYILETNISQ